MKHWTRIALCVAIAFTVSACERASQNVSAPLATATPSSPAWQRAFHRSFRKHYRISFLRACNQPHALGVKTQAYCVCAETGYEKAFSDTELAQLGSGTAPATVVQRAATIVQGCKDTSGPPRRK